ncbi:hypothetical protein DB347_08885 [Opitutaceae bacterium EW11]|nr:hypothetical protein DB347_08885 [Opitutaceae bacterium EW11]
MRRFVIILLSLAALAALAVALSPYWLDAALPAIARRFDATVGAYSRVGYGRFVLRDVVVTKPSATVRIASIEGETPWLWAARRIGGGKEPVVAGEWSVAVRPTGNRTSAPAPSGWVPLQDRLLRISDLLHRWLPLARTGPGRVSWPGNELRFAPVFWENRTLRTDSLEWRGCAAKIVAELRREPSLVRVHAEFVGRPLVVEAVGAGNDLKGTIVAWGQTAPWSATFPATGWMPSSADVNATSWTLDGSQLGLAGYATIAGDLKARWSNERFLVHADVHGTPAEKQGGPQAAKLPALHIEADATGDRTAYTVERFRIEAPGVKADLSGPVHVGFHEPHPGWRSRFHFTADLAQVRWLRATGTLTGDVDVEPRPSGWPALRFEAQGTGFAADTWKLKSLRIGGSLDWPALALNVLEIEADPDGRLKGTASADLLRKTLTEARLEGRVPSALVQRFLPKTGGFGVADVVVRASGPFAALQHEGTILVSELRVKGFRPATARLWWRGTGPQVQEFDAGIQAGTTEFVASGALRPESCVLQKLIWRHENVDRLTLQHPARLTWKPGLAVDAFDLVGPAGELRLTGKWGETGEVRFFARGIAAEWWHDFVPPAPFEWTIDQLSLNGKWDHGPAAVEASGHVTLILQGGRQVALDLQAKGDGKSLELDRLSATEGQTQLAALKGRLPLGIVVAPKPRIELSDSSQLAIQGSVNPEAGWWNELARRTGVKLDRPELSLDLSGTWSQPQGRMVLRLSELALSEKPGVPKLPRIQDLHAELVAEKDRIRLEPVEVNIEGQPVRMTATLPSGPTLWHRLRADPKGVLLREAQVSVRAAEVPIAPFTPFLAGMLTSQGTLDVDLTLSAEGPCKGHVRLNGAGTRPLGALGPLRNIRADIEAEGRQLRLNPLEATLGGQPIVLNGTVDVPPGKHPRYSLIAKGENLPFVRQEGLLVRGNVALKLETGNQAGPPLLSGEVALRDSLFLSDVRALVPSGAGAGPQRRPPYFAVSQSPFRAWRLDVNLVGQRFLRARTTLFNGTVSMKFHLLGTLGEPRAIGDVRIDEGQVLFPFARFDLGDASVRLTEENPFDPQLAVFGTSRRYGYDLKLELTGSATTPNLVFTSNPPLSSEQVLLLVMAGETPKNEVSYTTSQRFARLGTYFGQSLLGSLSGGQGDDRLTITSGERVSRQGRETYDVEYTLNKRWTAVGEYDEFDEYNIGLKRRILPRDGKSKEAGDERK